MAIAITTAILSGGCDAVTTFLGGVISPEPLVVDDVSSPDSAATPGEEGSPASSKKPARVKTPRSSATVDLKESSESYQVPGATYEELAANLKSASKRAARRYEQSGGEIGWAVLKMERNTSFSCNSQRGLTSSEWESRCAAEVHVDAEIVVVTPQPGAGLPPADQAAWDKVVAEVGEHEDGHAEINRESVESFEEALTTAGLLSATASGASAEDAQQAAIDLIESRLNRANNETWEKNERDQDAYHQRVGRYVTIPSRP